MTERSVELQDVLCDIRASSKVPAGWVRVDGGRDKVTAVYRSPAGWVVQHCGHPTALWPYQLWDPDGAEHRAPNGRAWPHLAMLAAYVALMDNAPARGDVTIVDVAPASDGRLF